MGHADSKDAFDKSFIDVSADTSVNRSTSSSRPSAIERQIAIKAELGQGNRIHREAADHAARRNSRPFGLTSFLMFFLLVLAGLAMLFTDSDGDLRKIAGAVQQTVGQVVHNNNASPATRLSSTTTHSSPTTSSPITTPSPASASAAAVSAAQTAAPKKVAEVATPTALSIPIADLSVRNRPELLEQLVRVYRSQLVDDANNSTARTALNQLQERSLSELQTIILEGDDAAAVKSVEIVSRLFPEAADTARYKYLVARTDRINDQAKDRSIAKPESSKPPATAGLAKTAAQESTAPEKSIPRSISSAAVAVTSTAENTPSSKPEIRAVSITPGAMIHERFVPDVEGNAFMVEVSYRNFDTFFKGQSDESEVSLVARLGLPGYSTVLAETPVEILGDRGTKSFVMTTLMPVDDVKEYKLNFIVNGEFLASRTVRPR